MATLLRNSLQSHEATLETCEFSRFKTTSIRMPPSVVNT